MRGRWSQGIFRRCKLGAAWLAGAGAALLCVAALVAQTPSQQLFNGLRWRLIGPFRAGRVVAVGGASGGSPNFFFGSVDGGVWATGDAGMVWEPTFAGQPVASIGALEVAPSDPSIIYVGTGETDIRSNLASGDGVYKTVDGGATWSNVGLKDTRQISRVVIDPSNPDVVYVGALGSAYGNSPDRGVYKTIDGGTTWAKVLFVNDATGIADLALAPEKPNLLFAAAWDAHRPPWSVYGPIEGPGSGLYRSQDGGTTWQPLHGHGLPQGEWFRSGIAVSNDGMRVYAVIDGKKPGLYVSNDGGDTWELRNADPRLTGRSWYFSRITIDPKNSDVFYVPNTALYRSEDAGKTLSIVRGAPGGDDYHQLWIDDKNSSRMILGTDHGTTISVDRGRTWTSWYNQPTGQMYHVATDDSFPYVVYEAEQDNGSIGVYSRTDHENIAPRDWFIAAQSESGYVVVDPLHKDVLFASGPNGSVVRFNKRTSLSQDITPWPGSGFGQDISERKYRDTWTPVLVMSPFDKRSLYFGTQYVMKTVDGGLSWQQISPDLTGGRPTPKTAPPNIMNDAPIEVRGGRRAAIESNPPTIANSRERGFGTIFTIAPSPLNGRLIWSGSDSGLIYVTRNGGTSWSNVTPPSIEGWSKISMIEASRFDQAEAYAAVDRHRLDDREPYLYRTRDYGKSWTSITQGLSAPGFLRAIREDVKKKGLLFAGTEFGIDVSFNDGDQWEPLQLNLPVTSVRDMTIHEDDLVVATHGRAFWVLDDIAPLRQAVEAGQAQKPFLYRPSVAVRVDHDPFPSTRIPLDEPTAKNPPEGAMIDYYLPAPAQEVTLKIFDAQQELVRQFSSANMTPPRSHSLVVAGGWILHPEPLTGEPGMHRFVWNLTWNSSGGVDSDLPNAGAGGPPQGPRAVPGVYEVVLSVDGVELRRPLTLIMDPRSPATSGELRAQLKLSQELYAGYQRAAQIAAEAGAELEQIRALTQRQRVDSSLKRSASAAAGELQAIIVGNDTPMTMGLRQVEAAMAADLSSARTGDRGPTQQEQDAYREAESSLLLRTGEWNKFRQHQLPTSSKSFSQAAGTGEAELQ